MTRQDKAEGGEAKKGSYVAIHSSGFRDFLLKAPSFFYHLGSDLSALSHVTSYWEYWWRNRDPGSLAARDAMEVFPAFLRSLIRDKGQGVPKAVIG